MFERLDCQRDEIKKKGAESERSQPPNVNVERRT
jgi:hypothetical protein